MWVGLWTDRINNKLEKSNLINEHAFNREPVLLIQTFSMDPHSVCIMVWLYVQNLTEMSHFKGNDMVIAIKLKNHERKNPESIYTWDENFGLVV